MQNLQVTILVTLYWTQMLASPPNVPVEVCEAESFQAACPSNQVIVMTTAKYGRMQKGRCVKRSLGFIGCHTNVLPNADRKCSGLQECSIRVPDSEFDLTKPCLEELKTYLQASYECLEVLKPPGACTDESNSWTITDTQKGFISNTVALKNRCATETLPLEIQALPGQRINVTLYDFNTPYESSGASHFDGVHSCDEFIVLVDHFAKTKRKLCPGNERISHAFTTSNNTLHVFFKKMPNSQMDRRFLIEFQAVGCKDIIPPDDMYFRRYENEATLGCEQASEEWNLVCVDGHWLGDTGNCSSTFLPGIHQGSETTSEHPYAVTVGIILSLTLVIGLMVLVLGIFFLRRIHKTGGWDGQQEEGSGAVEMKHVHEDIRICPQHYSIQATAAIQDEGQPHPMTKLQDDAAFKNNPSNDYAPIKFQTFKGARLGPHEDCREGLLTQEHMVSTQNRAVLVHTQGPHEFRNTVQCVYHSKVPPSPAHHLHCDVISGSRTLSRQGSERDKGPPPCYVPHGVHDKTYEKPRYCIHERPPGEQTATLSRKGSFMMNNSF